MRIIKAEIKNYKSFLDSGEINFTPGFNVIVGQNNVGKTALIEALSLKFANHPHRSLKTVEYVGAPIGGNSEVEITFEVDKEELLNILLDTRPQFFIPAKGSEDTIGQINSFYESLSNGIQLKGNFTLNNFGIVLRENYEPYQINLAQPDIIVIEVQIERPHKALRVVNSYTSTSAYELYTRTVAYTSKDRIYTFKAERLNLGEAQALPDPILAPNASNLASVLHLLHNKNSHRFQRFLNYVKTVFPQKLKLLSPKKMKTQVLYE